MGMFTSGMVSSSISVLASAVVIRIPVRFMFFSSAAIATAATGSLRRPAGGMARGSSPDDDRCGCSKHDPFCIVPLCELAPGDVAIGDSEPDRLTSWRVPSEAWGGVCPVAFVGLVAAVLALASAADVPAFADVEAPAGSLGPPVGGTVCGSSPDDKPHGCSKHNPSCIMPFCGFARRQGLVGVPNMDVQF